MKYKIIFMLLCYTYNAVGQDFQYYRHDVSVSLGVLSSPAKLHGYGPAPVAFSAQYAYQLSKLIGLCMIANYSPVKDGGWGDDRLQYIDEWGKPHYEYVQVHETVGEYLSIIPALRLNWVNKRIFTLYTKAAFGISYDTNEDKAYGAVQLSPLGITFGKRLYGTVELGIGRQGVLVLGLGYRFK